MTDLATWIWTDAALWLGRASIVTTVAIFGWAFLAAHAAAHRPLRLPPSHPHVRPYTPPGSKEHTA